MAAYLEYRLPFIFSSSPEAGALNISPKGSSFEVLLDNPIVIPRQAKNCYITVQNATAWWNIYNIEEGVNDQISVTYFDGLISVTVVLTIDAGLYDLDHLSAEIQRELNANGLPSDLFQLIPDQASQKTVIQFNTAGVQVDLSIPRNFSTILGFDERLVPALLTTGVQFEKSDNIANFNTVDYLLIHSDLVSRGIQINGIYNNTIAQLLIDVAPGSQIVSKDFNIPQIPANELIGEKRRNLRFWLTDQDNNLVDTNGELFSVRLIIHYFLKS